MARDRSVVEQGCEPGLFGSEPVSSLQRTSFTSCSQSLDAPPCAAEPPPRLSSKPALSCPCTAPWVPWPDEGRLCALTSGATAPPGGKSLLICCCTEEEPEVQSG